MPDYSRDADLVPVLFIFPTIETCFNCFGTCSSDAKEKIKKTTKTPGKFKSYATSHDPPPPLAGKGESPRWRQCLKEKCTPTKTIRYIIYQTIFGENSLTQEPLNRRFKPLKSFDFQYFFYYT